MLLGVLPPLSLFWVDMVMVLSTKQCVVVVQSLIESDKGFVLNVSATLRNLAVGLGRLLSIYEQPNLRSIIRMSFIMRSTEESVCILTAETVDLKNSILFSVPLALLAGAITVILPEAYSKVKSFSQQKWQ
jgi:hypothetical protein